MLWLLLRNHRGRWLLRLLLLLGRSHERGRRVVSGYLRQHRAGRGRDLAGLRMGSQR